MSNLMPIGEVIGTYKNFDGGILPNWLCRRPEVSNGAKLFYVVLAQHYGKKRKAYPKLTTLAKEMACSISRIQAYINELIELGLIKKHRYGLNKVNGYLFLNHKWVVFKDNSEDHSLCGDEQSKYAEPNSEHLLYRKEDLEKRVFLKNKKTLEEASPPVTRKLIIKNKKQINPILHKKQFLQPLQTRKPIINKPIKHKPRVSPQVREVINYWVNNNLSMHKEDTASFATAIRYINELYEGTLFSGLKDQTWHGKKFILAEIKRSIDNFVLALGNNEYMPINKQYLEKISFVQFFYNPKPTSNEKFRSQFLIYLNKPTLVSNSKVFAAKDVHPEVTEILTRWWKKLNQEMFPLTTSVSNSFVYCGKNLETFYVENKEKLHFESFANPLKVLATRLTESIDWELRENDSAYKIFNHQWLTSDRTFTDRLPNHLKKVGIIGRQIRPGFRSDGLPADREERMRLCRNTPAGREQAAARAAGRVLTY